MKKYPTATSFRTAVENPSPPWALKGGYAMQLRTESARATKDIDLAIKEAKLFAKDET